MSDTSVDKASKQGATVVITHRVRDGQQAAYDEWLNEIGPLCRAATGNIDWQIVRPIAGLTATNTVIVRFDTIEHLQRWMQSEERKRLIDKARPFTAGDDYYISTGLDFWFVPEGAKAQVPVRWKQFLATWSAIYPLVLGVPLLVLPLMRRLGTPPNHYFDTLVVTAAIVALMAYVVMPRYTKILRRWLFQ